MIPIPGDSTALPPDSDNAELVIKLMESSVAGADAASMTRGYGNVRIDASIVVGSPKAGYLYRRFDSQDDGAGPTSLLNDTDGRGYYGRVHDRSRFAFMAFPESVRTTRYGLAFVVNADNTIWKLELPRRYRVDYVELRDGADSWCRMTGSGCGWLEGALVFPADPARAGCSKMD